MRKNKRTDTYAGMLGATQLEMALLVGVTRGHWSMFDIGKRDLPRESYEKLAQLLVGTLELKKQTKMSDAAYNQETTRLKLQILFTENIEALGKLQRTRDILLKKQQNHDSRQLLRQCLNTSTTIVNGQHITEKATKGKAKRSDEKYAVDLAVLDYKIELLQCGQTLLEKKLKQFNEAI